MNELIWQAQNGDKKAMSAIIKDNMGLVWNVVKRFNNRGYEKEDLFQIGCIGFVKAIQKFDINFGTQLSTYAVPMIIGEIKRFLRDDGLVKVSRSIKELSYKIDLLQSENLKQGKDAYSISELSKILDVSSEEIVMALESQEYAESLDRSASEDDDSPLLEKILVSEDEYGKLLNKIEIEDLLKNLTDVERKIIIYRYIKEKTQVEISKVMGVSQVQVSRVEKRALEKMKLMTQN